MKVTMLLADSAQIQNGKLYILGGGWTGIKPGNRSFAVVWLVSVPWNATNEKHSFELKLLDTDGKPFVVPSDKGPQEVKVGGEFEAGRPPGTAKGSSTLIPMSVNITSLPLPPQKRLYWKLFINGESKDEWELPFSTNDPE